MQHKCICTCMCNSRFAGRSSRVVKWKLETLKHISNRSITGAQLCAPVRGLLVNYGLSWPYKSLPRQVSFLEIFNQIFLLILIGSRRDPGLASEEVLVSIRFHAN